MCTHESELAKSWSQKSIWCERPTFIVSIMSAAAGRSVALRLLLIKQHGNRCCKISASGSSIVLHIYISCCRPLSHQLELSQRHSSTRQVSSDFQTLRAVMQCEANGSLPHTTVCGTAEMRAQSEIIDALRLPSLHSAIATYVSQTQLHILNGCIFTCVRSEVRSTWPLRTGGA